jgi:hypothetical protein
MEVKEWGVGTDEGGLWINVTSGAISCAFAFGELNTGSLGGGLGRDTA